jgi:hypothetical protein
MPLEPEDVIRALYQHAAPGDGPFLVTRARALRDSGMVTLDAASNGNGGWPLPAGGYIAYYLLNDGYTSVSSIDFNIL